jgi:TolB-like protein
VREMPSQALPVAEAHRLLRLAPRLAVVAIVTIAVALLVAGAMRLRRPPISDRSFAVLPFKNLGPDASAGMFASGFTDNVTDELARVSGLRVIARSSVDASTAAGKTPDVREIGRRLNVSRVVEGSVERSGERIKVVARMERVADGSIEWSKTYLRPASDGGAVPADVVSDIANLLNASAPLPGHVPSEPAHEALLKGQFELAQSGADNLERAEADFEAATRADPAFADAYYFWGIAKYNRAVTRSSLNLTAKDRTEIEGLERKALQLDSQSQPPRALLASLALQFDWDWAGAEREYKLALAPGPEPTICIQYALLLAFEGRFAESDEQLRRAQDLDPIGPATLNSVMVVRSIEGRSAEEREIARRLAMEAPGTPLPQRFLAQSYLDEDRPDLAAPIVAKLHSTSFDAMLAAQAGRHDDALRLIGPLEDQYPSMQVSCTELAYIYARLGDEAGTVKWLNRAADAHELTVLNAGVLAAYKPLRHSAGFQAFLKRVGLAKG